MWLTEALEPAREVLGDDGVHHTAIAIRSATGIEALIWLTDIGGLSRRRAGRGHAIERPCHLPRRHSPTATARGERRPAHLWLSGSSRLGTATSMTLSMRPLTDAVVGASREALAVGAAVAHYRRPFEVPVPPSTQRGDVDDTTGGARPRTRSQRGRCGPSSRRASPRRASPSSPP